MGEEINTKEYKEKLENYLKGKSKAQLKKIIKKNELRVNQLKFKTIFEKYKNQKKNANTTEK